MVQKGHGTLLFKTGRAKPLAGGSPRSAASQCESCLLFSIGRDRKATGLVDRGTHGVQRIAGRLARPRKSDLDPAVVKFLFGYPAGPGMYTKPSQALTQSLVPFDVLAERRHGQYCYGPL
jgi:hypothetical protein